MAKRLARWLKRSHYASFDWSQLSRRISREFLSRYCPLWTYAKDLVGIKQRSSHTTRCFGFAQPGGRWLRMFNPGFLRAAEPWLAAPMSIVNVTHILSILITHKSRHCILMTKSCRNIWSGNGQNIPFEVGVALKCAFWSIKSKTILAGDVYPPDAVCGNW